MMTEKKNYTPPCEECGGRCCKYIAIEIDRPVSKKDYGYIRWYLLHENVNIFIDHKKKWHVEFRTGCVAQLDDHRCSIYEDRPGICRDHGVSEDECEFFDSPYLKYFSDVKEYEAYLAEKGVDWRDKRSAK